MAEFSHAVTRAVDTSQNEAHDIDVESSDLLSQLSAMRTQLDEARAEIERLRAAATAPCPHCNVHSEWTVRVRTMAGQVHTVDCPNGPRTQIYRIKKDLAQFDPKFYIQQQLVLALPCKTSSSSSSHTDQIDMALADGMTLASCGVSNGDLLELFLVDMEWDEGGLAMIAEFKRLTKDYYCIEFFDDDCVLPLSWALVNAVCLMFSKSLLYCVLYILRFTILCVIVRLRSIRHCRLYRLDVDQYHLLLYPKFAKYFAHCRRLDLFRVGLESAILIFPRMKWTNPRLSVAPS
jgi:hypothetical protein